MTNDAITTDKNEEKALPPTNTEDFDLLDLFQRVSKILGRGNAANISIPERPGQVRVLALLDDADNGKMSQRDMLDKLDIRSASLSEILRKLEVKKHVIRRRDPLDKRGIIVEITEAGHIVLCESEMERDQAQTELFSSLSDEQKVQLAKTLKTLLTAWEESGLSAEASKGEKAGHTHSHGDDSESKQWQHGKRQNAARKPGKGAKSTTGKKTSGVKTTITPADISSGISTLENVAASITGATSKNKSGGSGRGAGSGKGMGSGRGMGGRR